MRALIAGLLAMAAAVAMARENAPQWAWGLALLNIAVAMGQERSQ